jgi:transcriptional regulator with XRE-family HTH domain
MRADAQAGERIKALRLEHGLSQRDLSAPGMSYAYLSRIEAGERTPSLSALIELADRLETSALYLATGKTSGRCPFCGRS